MQVNKLVFTIILFVITLLVGGLFVVPQYQQAAALQSTVTQKQAEYDGKSFYYTKVAGLVKVIEENPDALAKIQSALPTMVSFAPEVNFFNQAATDAKLQVNSVELLQVSKAEPDQAIKTVSFRVNLSGSYAALRLFLAALDDSARIFEVDSLAFSAPSAALQNRAAAKNAAQHYNFVLEIKTYVHS